MMKVIGFTVLESVYAKFAVPTALPSSSFVSSTYARKVRFFCLPLTLIGAFESCALGNRNPCAVFSDPFLGVTHEAF